MSDITTPASIVLSDVERSVLSATCDSVWMYAREISMDAGISTAQASKVLTSLAFSGLVSRHRFYGRTVDRMGYRITSMGRSVLEGDAR